MAPELFNLLPDSIRQHYAEPADITCQHWSQDEIFIRHNDGKIDRWCQQYSVWEIR